MPRPAGVSATGKREQPIGVPSLDEAAATLKVTRSDLDQAAQHVRPWPSSDGITYWSIAQLRRQLVLMGVLKSPGPRPRMDQDTAEVCALELSMGHAMHEVAKAHGITANTLKRTLAWYRITPAHSGIRRGGSRSLLATFDARPWPWPDRGPGHGQ